MLLPATHDEDDDVCNSSAPSVPLPTATAITPGYIVSPYGSTEA